MQQISVAVPASVKNTADQKNQGSRLKFQQEIMDLSFKSKGQVIRLFEVQSWELAKLKKEFLTQQEELFRLKRQRTEDLIVIGEQKDEIIFLYSRLNKDSEFSPLSKAG